MEVVRALAEKAGKLSQIGQIELPAQLLPQGIQSIIERRMADADREMSHFSDAEFLVINDDFDQALADLESIIRAQALTLERQKLKYPELIASIKLETV